MNNNYEYQSDSYSQSLAEKASGGHEIGGVPVVYAAVALLVGWWLCKNVGELQGGS